MNDKPYKLQQFISCLQNSLAILPDKMYVYISGKGLTPFFES